TSGRASILPSIATKEELHTANSLTQLTQWTTVTIGSFLGGASVTAFGYKLAFAFNAFSFLFSAWCISRLRVEKGFRAERSGLGCGASFAHRIGRRISFTGYKRTISICYIIHGGSYVFFSQAPTFSLALFFIGLSRAAVAVSSVLNVSQLLRHVSDEFRGRVF